MRPQQGCPYLQYKIPTVLTPQHTSENDCFACDAVREAEETHIPLSSFSIGGRPCCNLRFADDINLLGGTEKQQQLTETTYCCWFHRDNQLKQKQNSRQQHQVKTMYQYMDKRENAGRSGPVQIPRTHKKKQRRKSIKEVKIRLAQAHLVMKGKQYCGKTTPSVFLQRLNSTSHLSCQYCSTEVTAER